MTYVAKCHYLDEDREITIEKSRDNNLPHILNLAEYKVARDKECDCTVVRIGNEWLVSPYNRHFIEKYNMRSYVLRIVEE